MTCPQTALVTKPEFSRFLFYKALTLIPVSVALIAIVRYSGSFYWPLVYIGLLLGHAFVMYSVKCPHCAYYKMDSKTHHCFMWWGIPKIYKPRPGPEKKFVGVYAPIGMLTLTLFPIYWLRFEWELLLVFLLSVVVIVLSIAQTECRRCLNFQCGHNTVPDEIREAHLAQVGQAA